MNCNKQPESALGYEIAQEQAAALGRLGRALEAALAALSEHDGLQSHCRDRLEQTAAGAVRAGLLKTPATRCGALSFSARPADCAIRERSCANIAFLPTCRTGWAPSERRHAFPPAENFRLAGSGLPSQSFVHPLAAMSPC